MNEFEKAKNLMKKLKEFTGKEIEGFHLSAVNSFGDRYLIIRFVNCDEELYLPIAWKDDYSYN